MEGEAVSKSSNMTVKLEQDTTNSYALTINGITFSVTIENCDEFSDEEVSTLEEFVKRAMRP